MLVLNYKIFFIKDTNILFPVSIYPCSVWAYIVHNFVNYFLKFPCESSVLGFLIFFLLPIRNTLLFWPKGGGLFIYVKFLTYLSSVLKRVNCFSPGV